MYQEGRPLSHRLRKIHDPDFSRQGQGQGNDFVHNGLSHRASVSTITLMSKDHQNAFFIRKELPGNEPQLPFENEAAQYWKKFFDFGYYLLLTSFRFVWDPITGYYNVRTNIIQRLLQWILCFFTTIYFLIRVYRMSGWSMEEHPSLYFDMAYYFFDTTFLVALFLAFEKQENSVLELFDELQRTNDLYGAKARKAEKTKRWTFLICTGCLGTLVLQVLQTFLDNDWSFDAFINFWVQEAKETIQNETITDFCPFCYGILAMTCSLFEKALNAFSDILFSMNVLMFNNLVNSFELEMNSRSDGSAEHILEHYWWLKEVMYKSNNAMGIINGAFIAGNLPFYATNVFEVFGSGNIFMRLRYMFYCSYWFPSLFLAAHANHKIDAVKDWIVKEENYSRIPNKKVKVFMHEINYRTVGIASFGMFMVTWHTVGNIISVILSYALLKSQLKQSPAGDLEAMQNQTWFEAANETMGILAL